MCGSCGCSPCSCSGDCDPANEPLSSALNNFVIAFFGAVTKSCVNDEVVWTLPCDLEAGNPNFPRIPNEGIACYLSRFIETFLAAQVVSIGNKGYLSRALTNANITITRAGDFINQDFTGTLTGPVDIILSSAGATLGDEFYISFTNLAITSVNNLEIKTDAVNLLTINTAGTLNGYLKAVYTGAAWKLTTTIVTIT